MTIAPGGTFQSAATGTVTTHVLSLAGNLTNNGTLEFSTNGNTAGADITFTGASNNTFGGSGATTDIRTITINKGTSFANTLELNPTNFTVQGTTTDGAPMAFLTLSNGTLKISGTFTATGRVFTAAGYAIPATTGFWLNNPNFTVAGQNGSPATNGLLRISQGTFNVGTVTGNSMGFATGSTITVEGGSVNTTGRFGVAAMGNVINYTQSGGIIRVCTVGQASTLLASFDLGTSLSSVINMSGGTIINQLANTAASGPGDYRNQAGGGISGVTGGTLQLGNAASGVARAFIMRGVVPNLVITNTSANHIAAWDVNLFNFNNSSLNITINTGNTLDIGNNIFLMAGSTFTNNGTFTATGGSSRFYWYGLLGLPQNYTGSGTVTAPMTSFELNNSLGLTLDPASPNIVTSRIILFAGNITNANKLTVGDGGATTGTIQIGNTATPSNGGTFDVAPVFNLGTGGQIIFYLRTILARTTGNEINPTRILTSMVYDDTAATHSLTIAGGDLTLSGTASALTLTNGRIITGANNLILSSGTATVTRTNGYVDGNFRKNFSAVASKTFEVGTANGYSPVTVNATAGTPADFTVKATQGTHSGLDPSISLQRYWTLTATGLTADLTFNYLDPTDIPVTANENNFVIFKYAAGAFTQPGGSVNAAANTATITGVTSFSDWTLAEATAVLPVNLLTFSGYKESNHNVLRWTTVNESNNRGFEIQRSTDGVNFGVIGFVNSQAPGGNSTGNLNYTFTDNIPAGAKQYYRLRQVDIDNHGKYSSIVLIRGDKPLTLAIGGLFPNPANNIMNVIIDAPVRNNITLVITDIAGKIVKQQPANVETGSNTITMNISNLANGTYTVKVVCKADGESAVSSFIKQ